MIIIYQVKIKGDITMNKVIPSNERKSKKLSISIIILIIVLLSVSIVYIINHENEENVDLVSKTPGASKEYSPLTSEDNEALEKAKLRHVDVWQLSKTNEYRQYTCEFDEAGIFTVKLELNGSSLTEELYKYGYLADDIKDDANKDYYLVVIKTPFSPVRFVGADMHANDGHFDFGFTSLDLGPFTVKEYGTHKVATTAESAVGMLVALPSSMTENGFSARFVHWEDLDVQSRIEVVMDTVFMHEDFDLISRKGVENTLSFELAILNDHLSNSIDYLKKYCFKNAETEEISKSTIARYMLNALLNRYQKQTYDNKIIDETVKSLLWEVTESRLYMPANSLIIPEMFYFIQVIEDDNNMTIYAYANIYYMNPPYVLEERGFPFTITLHEANGTYTIVDYQFIYDTSALNNFSEQWSYYKDTIESIDSSRKDNTFNQIRTSLLQMATETYNSLTEYQINDDDVLDGIDLDFTSIKESMASNFNEISNPYTAILRDCSLYVFDKNYGDDALQVSAIYPLSEEFDNPITVAVLASTYDGNTSESQNAKLYVVTAEYNEQTWEVRNIDIQEKETLSMSEFPKLQEHSFSSIYESLYSELEYNIDTINTTYNLSLPIPIKKELPLEGSYLNLNIQSGIVRFINVHRLIRGEKDSGTMIPIWYAQENPNDLSGTAFTEAIKSSEWTEVQEGEEGRMYSHTDLGFLGYLVQINIENDEGVFEFHYSFDTINNKAILMIYRPNEKAKYYVSEGESLCLSGIETFKIRTDVTEYMIDDEKGPTLPDYREELRYLTPIVGDMPGGIVSVETTVSSALEEMGYESNIIKNEDQVIRWAQSIGEEIEYGELLEISQIPISDTPDVSWDITLAAQEGKGSLQIIGFSDSGQVYIRKVYRLYGSKETREQYFTFGDRSLFDRLCILSFGETIEN